MNYWKLHSPPSCLFCALNSCNTDKSSKVTAPGQFIHLLGPQQELKHLPELSNALNWVHNTLRLRSLHLTKSSAPCTLTLMLQLLLTHTYPSPHATCCLPPHPPLRCCSHISARKIRMVMITLSRKVHHNDHFNPKIRPSCSEGLMQ